LFRARIATDAGDERDAEALLDEVARELGSDQLSPHDQACLGARRLDQLAYIRARGWREHPERLALAEALYRQIPADGPEFVVFRHHQGLAWCLWRQNRPGALDHAKQSARAAGDAGFLHLRGISLRLQAQMLGSTPEAELLLRRAARITATLDGRPG
jgi:hypothetical protein